MCKHWTINNIFFDLSYHYGQAACQIRSIHLLSSTMGTNSNSNYNNYISTNYKKKNKISISNNNDNKCW